MVIQDFDFNIGVPKLNKFFIRSNKAFYKYN